MTETKMPAGIAPHIRDKSPEYSSEGSVGKEIKHSNRKSSPDSSPERAAFTPIKQFRTSPEVTSDTIQITNTAETDMTSVNHHTEKFITEEVLNTRKNTATINVDITESKKIAVSDNKDVHRKRPSSPKKESPDRKSPSQKETHRRPTSPQKARTPSPGKRTREEPTTVRKESFSKTPSSQRTKSPIKDENSRPQSPTKTARKSSFPQRSQSPQKEQVRPVSPTKTETFSRKPSLPARSPSPKREKSRSPSPKKESLSSTKTVTVTRRSSLKQDTSYNASSPRRSSIQRSPSPAKDALKSRSPSPKKQSPERRSPSPDKSKSPSPQRSPNKRTREQLSSPSVSPCSSPERSSATKQDKPKPIRKTSGPKSPEREPTRTSRRSSIPRADQSAVRKVVETKIEIRSKPTTRIPASTNKTKPGQNPVFRSTRTDSQNSLDKQTTTRTYSSTTTVRRIGEKPKEPIKKTVAPKKTVTTTAVISLQKPTVTSQVRHTASSTVSKATTYKRTPSKEITPTKTSTPTGKKTMITTTTKRVASRTNTPKSKPVPNQEETDRSSALSSPEPIISDKVKSEAFIQQLIKDEITVHGFKDETINLEFTDNDIENEPRPELFPETEDDEDVVNQNHDIPDENEHHITEKTINVDSKRKVAQQFMVTIKKPTTQLTPTKTPSKPVTTRSSSGPIKGSPQTSSKTVSLKTTTNKRQTNSTVQKAESLNLIRTTNDKNVVQKRQTSKSEISTTKPLQPTKVTNNKQVTETGIASRNVTTAKSATIKRVVPVKKKPIDSAPSSTSEDEEDNVPSVVTPNQQEQQYIEELEEMRRNEELEYASKLTATTNQENQLLSVIVQHPKSSRESSPDYSNRSQPFCTVSDDGGSAPRYADLISEPEDVEVFDPKHTPKIENYSQKQPKFEQVTDLDEESEVEEVKLNVSVADRVTHFIETSKAHTVTQMREEPEPQAPADSPKNVLKAKAMFETIARNQTSVPAPNNKPVDILSRPSIFEARRGQTAPKPVYSDTFPRVKSPEHVQRRGSIHMDYQQQEQVETIQYEENLVDVDEVIPRRTKSPSPVREAPVASKPEKKESAPVEKTPSAKREPVASVKVPEQTPKTDPTSRSVRKEPTPTFDRKRPESVSKPKPFEKTISASAEVSSKRAFFERKVQAQTSPSKETKPYSPNKDRKPLTESIQNKENIRGPSPPRKTSQTTSFIENERKSSRVSPERKVSSPSPTKDRKPSLKSESPERKTSVSKTVKERRTSFTKEDTTTHHTATIQKKDSFTKTTERKTSPSRESPERRAPITEKCFPDHISKSPFKDTPEQKVPTSPVRDRRPSTPALSPERSPQRKPSRTSPDRSAKSPERVSPKEVEPVELNKAGKFGVTLRRTSSTNSAGTPRRPSIPGETQEIEDVTDLSLLEIMMEKAVGYEQRRRIRAQIRIVKKDQDDRIKTTRQKSPTRSPTRDHKITQEPATRTPDKRPETKRASSPSKSFQERVTEQRSTTRRTTTTTTSAKPTTTTVEHTTTRAVRERSPVDKPLTNGYHSPDRSSPILRTTSPQRKESLPDRRSPVSMSSRADTQIRKSSKTEAVEVTSSVRSQKRTETLVESGVDCITSSYGVGPTDEKGRPLFGLRALRRTNTNKQLTDEVEVRREQEHQEVQEPVCDAKGRPLFGGLKALRAQEPVEATMPEQTSTQLRELVERHEKVVRETNGPQDQPRQKPKAKLRDSFILQEEEQSGQGHLAEVNSLNRGLSLRSIIQKHENIANTAGTVRSEMESSHTVVTSRSTVSSDGTVSLNRDVIQGELSAKNGEEPVGKVTRTQYTYQSPQGDDQGINKVTTTTTSLGRRASGPKITEIEDVHETSERKSSIKSKDVEEVTGRRSVERVPNRKSSPQKSSSEDDEQRRNERFSSQEEDEEVQKISRVSSTSQRYTSSTDSAKRTSSTPTRQTKTSSPSLRRQRSSEDDSAEDKRKTVVRGDSVRALQHKFQQATVSSTLKQSTALSADKRSGRQSPEKRKESLSDATTVSRHSPTSDTKRDSITETTRRESLKTSGDSTVTRVTETTTTSFLDNTSRVTGVQDVLTRMRNADLVSESGDTDADREARALLNKFLGASVILQGMEQGMRAGTVPEGTPGSAALVSSVEKQRVATTRQKEEDIESIWDELVLKALLEQCTDYEGRRRLRARLRTVMAEHKACADLVAVTGGSSAANASESETTQVSTKTQGGSVTRTEVHTRTSTNRLTKASSVSSSPFAKFKQLERQNSAPSAGAAPLFKFTDARVARSASTIKDRLLSWVQAQTREYKNIQIENFSTSWNNGLAFCALIHHFCPDAFDYDQLKPDQRRHNFELAFRVAEEEAGIAPLLDVEDMVVMRRPDWKCVFTYVQSVYRRFHSTPEAVRC
ncbi:serine/arginine repetitive matrix protein 2-like isoform X2 [Homalodisca vitripennis]|uniref:serine/arginine repetitive matrix protein 2-like isoform X2 n=1 Tax=Homalodisca vitripennis TaxID=197043 RepID=UPI001EEB96D9|nr:serine/arginine repetitive matrix protein 2-like isoform X2 [Homalodisca vitripennis]